MTDPGELTCEMRAESVRGLTHRECSHRRLCFRCGGPVERPRLWWCSDECVRIWSENHEWNAARWVAWLAADHKCLRCGKSATEVNHRIPLVGRGYHRGCVHHQENLEPLCHDCHVEETIRQLYERKQAAVDAGTDYHGRRARKRLGLPQLPSSPTPGFDMSKRSLWETEP